MEIFFLLLLIGIMAFALGSGYPVAFALPGAAILTIGLAAASGYLFAGNTDIFFHSGGPSQWLSAGVTNLRGVYWEVDRDTLIAIPLFIFMGIMLQRSKIAEDLLVTMAQLFGPIPGGLGISVVFVGALLAATTGIVGATVVAMGLISLPAMLRNNYSPQLATGTIAASGTLGQIIPPSIVLIILADQLASASDQAGTIRTALYKQSTGELSLPSEYAVTSTSAGEMFLGAFVPGLVLVGLYMLYILVFAILRPKDAPSVPYEGKRNAKFWLDVVLTLVPPLALIFLVLGSIIAGIATVNQAGAIGAAGALVMAGYRLPKAGTRNIFVPAALAIAGLALIALALAYFPMNIKQVLATGATMTGIYIGVLGTVLVVASLIWSALRAFKMENTLSEVMVETAKTTSLVFIILLGAAMLTAAFRAFGGEDLVRDFLNGLPGGFWSKFFIVMLVIFVLGFFLDFIEIAVVVVPIIAPILLADPSANITAVWLGVMIGLNIQTSFLTPPFGFALFYLRGVAPKAVRTVSIYRGVIAFIGLQLLALVVVAFYPPLVNYLPARTSLLAVTAPPPVNPGLQYCIADYIHDEFEDRGDEISAAIERAQGLDVSYLPASLSRDWQEGLEKAAQAIPLMNEINEADLAMEQAAPEYRPVHTVVRRIERDMNRINDNLEEARTLLSRGFGDPDRLEARIAEREQELAALEAQIPDDWLDTQAAFNELASADRRARQLFQRTVDQAYQPVPELIDIIAAADRLPPFEAELNRLREAAPTLDEDTVDDVFRPVESAIGDVPAAREIRSLLSDARGEIEDGNFDEADTIMAEAQALLQSEIEWRTRAEAELLPDLRAYEAAIRDTIGLRSQPRLPREQALDVAACNANHRDISLNF
ncbi:TRAP transporter large permease [Anianabacter salinae]|uniref:TRAP transporter large permease n=1 Tax=Anianabacter salinae TaxID=2851023 RepID=UPI00225E1EAC|nr:TRAP transporter large permease subunit [Anianabacter salinae]MBV0911131.1 TRAP transporter large permease subunit [Anianabacter salinae]